MRHIRACPAPTALLLLLLPLLALGCRGEEEKALEEEVLETLRNTPDHIAAEVLRTCDKWRRIDRGKRCTEDDARRDQFECWLEKGYPKLLHGYEHRLRKRTRDSTTLLKQDHCMELRRWRLIHGRHKTYEHIFGKPRSNRARKR